MYFSKGIDNGLCLSSLYTSLGKSKEENICRFYGKTSCVGFMEKPNKLGPPWMIIFDLVNCNSWRFGRFSSINKLAYG